MIRKEDMRREQADMADLDVWAEAEARRLLAAAFETLPYRPGLAADLITAGNQPGSPAPADRVVGLVRNRAARARRRQALLPVGAFALAAAVAGGITAGAAQGGGAAPAPDARTVLTAAVVKTSAQTFRFRETESSLGSPAVWGGDWNPATATGEVRLFEQGGTVHESRYIGKYVYTRNGTLTHGKPWKRDVVVLSWMVPINPADLLASLKESGSVRREGPASGPGWTGTRYGFTEREPAGTRETVGGVVSVDSSGRVRELTIAVRWHAGPAKGGHNYTVINTITFGDFGIAVSVTAPPASQVYIGS